MSQPTNTPATPTTPTVSPSGLPLLDEEQLLPVEMTAPAKVVLGLKGDRVYETSKWERFLHERRNGRDTTLRGSARECEDAVQGAYAERQEKLVAEGKAEPKPVDGKPIREATGAFSRELFTRMYNVHAEQLTENKGTWDAKAHKILEGLPEWQGLVEGVEGDPDFAAIAASSMLKKTAEVAAELVEAAESEGEGGENGLPGAEDRARAAMRAACRQASQEVQDAKEALGGLAPGLESCPRTHEQADPKRMVLAERLMHDAELREILRRAGRLQRLARTTQRIRSEFSYEEFVDVEQGGDIARMLPTEIAYLADPDLEVLTLKALVDRTALQYKLEGTEKQGRGPIFVMTDASGSMHGDGMKTAAAICLAAMGVGAREKRTVTCACFDTRVLDALRVEKNGEAYAMSRYDGKRQDDLDGGLVGAALRVAGWQAQGGTDFNAPLSYAVKHGGVLEDRADLIFVTDGYASVSAKILEMLAEAKSRGLRVYGVVTGGGQIEGAVRDICDEILDIDRTRDPLAAAARMMPQPY